MTEDATAPAGTASGAATGVGVSRCFLFDVYAKEHVSYAFSDFEGAVGAGGNIQLSPLPALIGLGPHASLRVFHWPHDARPTIGGRTGSLHAKTAVADDHAKVVAPFVARQRADLDDAVRRQVERQIRRAGGGRTGGAVSHE